jgi:protein PsiE
MKLETDHLSLLRRRFHRGVNLIENAGLLVIAIATTVALYQEIMVMVDAGKVTLSDLLLMFLYLEVLAMVGRYFESGHLPVRFPLYIGMVALARYLIIDIKQIDEWRILAVAIAILLLTVAVLVIRYGHLKYPYTEDAEASGRRRYGRE